MVFHVAFVEGDAIHHQVSVFHGAAVDRKGRAEDGTGHIQKVHKGIGHRADVAFGGGVKGGAVFKIDLLYSLVQKKTGGPETVGHSLARFLGPGFQGDDKGLGAGIALRFFRDPIIEADAHTALHKK